MHISHILTSFSRRLFIVFLLLFSLTPLASVSPAHATTETIYTGTNTALSGDDNSAGPFPVGFSFPFYGTNYTQAYVNINGTLNFDGGFSEYDNNSLYYPGAGNAILPFWDDIITHSGAQSIYYKTIGSAPNRTFIVQWTNMYSYARPSVQMGTFQVLLYENGGKIQLQYRDVLGDSQAQGGDATIGIQSTSENYSQYSYLQEVLSSHKAILYTPNGPGDYTVTDNAPYDYVYLSDPAWPGIPNLTSPTDGATGVSTASATFTWDAAANATSYCLLAATDSSFATVPVNICNIAGTSRDVTGLDGNTTYYWRVEADNASGSALSGASSFTTGAANQAPSTPTALGPTSLTSHQYVAAGDISTPLTFALADPDLSDQVKYHIQISTVANFASRVLDYTSALGAQGSRSFTVGQAAGGGSYATGSASTVLSDGPYYWRVQAIDAGGLISSNATVSGIAFTVDTAAPTFTGGLTASVSGTSGTVSWTAGTDAGSGLAATAYTVQLASDASFTQDLTTATQASLTYTATLTPGTWYTRVRATDAVGNSSAYQTGSLTIAAPVSTATPTPATTPNPVAIPTAAAAENLTVQTVDKKGTDGNPIISSLPTFSGTTEPGATVTVTVHSDPLTCTTTADSAGHWSCTLATALPAGQHTVLVSAVTPSGGTLSLASFPVTVPAQLAQTGSSALLAVPIGLLLIACGSVLFRSTRRRQQP